jgi:hypothetical protein
MPEPFELIDEAELLFYSLIIAELKRQKKKIFNNPSLVFTDAFWASEATIMLAAFLPFMEKQTKEAISFGMAELASVVDVDPVLENASLFANEKAGQLITRINITTQAEVADILAQSVEEQWGLDELTAALDPWFNPQRARLIAITETTGVYMGGAQFAADELRGQGYDVSLVWVTVRDNKVDDICRKRDGKAQGEGWEVAAPAHPGCRCDVVIRINNGT